MDKNKIRKEIATLIDSIKNHSDEIGDNKHIPQLELELILSKIKSLYEKSIVFNYLNSVPEEKIQKEIPSTTIEEKIMVKISKKEDSQSIDATTATPTDLFSEPEKKATESPKVEIKVETEKKEEAKQPSKINLTDIKSAIGINDKFQIANELFEGNMQEYEIAIQQFNSSENMESATMYFNSLQKLYNWDLEHETVKRLLNLIERRYS